MCSWWSQYYNNSASDDLQSIPWAKHLEKHIQKNAIQNRLLHIYDDVFYLLKDIKLEFNSKLTKAFLQLKSKQHNQIGELMKSLIIRVHRWPPEAASPVPPCGRLEQFNPPAPLSICMLDFFPYYVQKYKVAQSCSCWPNHWGLLGNSLDVLDSGTYCTHCHPWSSDSFAHVFSARNYVRAWVTELILYWNH